MPPAPISARSALGPSLASPAEAALVSAVLRTGAAQADLLPALMRAYVAADHVVGLDVDQDHYDKFSMRNCVDLLLMEFWKVGGGGGGEGVVCCVGGGVG